MKSGEEILAHVKKQINVYKNQISKGGQMDAVTKAIDVLIGIENFIECEHRFAGAAGDDFCKQCGSYI